MKRLFSLLVFTVLSAPAFAGKEVHGGGAIVCRNPAKEIHTSYLLDLWIGTLPPPMGLGLKIEPFAIPFHFASRVPMPEVDGTPAELQEKYERYALDRLYQVSPFFHKRVLENLQFLRPRIYMLPANVKLKLPDDSGNNFEPAGCTLEWAAAYYERTSSTPETLYVDSEIWNSFTPLHRAALMLHEAIYLTERQSADENLSKRSRKVVAGLFSDLALERVNAEVPEGAELCLVEPATATDRATLFWRWLRDKETIRQFAMINGHYVLSRKHFAAAPLVDEDPVSYRTLSVFEGFDDILLWRDAKLGHEHFQVGPVTDYGRFTAQVNETNGFLRDSCGSPQRNNALYFRTIEILTKGFGK